MEWSVVGSPVWSIVKKYSQSLSMSVVDRNMKAVSMNLCAGVTAVLNDNRQVRLFDVRKGIYSPMLKDDEVQRVTASVVP
eukprot:506936-Ditylum_brightwellii.AAC.1